MSEIITLQNKNLTVEISTLGAELISAKFLGEEKLWKGGNGFWAGTAPVLFPFCGNVFDGFYTFEEKAYQIKSHGFARKSEFKVINKQKTQATFLLESSSETKSVYPFDFNFKVMYKLTDFGVGVYYFVENCGEKDMFFNVGSHESYALSGDLNDYYISFDGGEKSIENSLLKNNFLTGEKETLSLTENGLKLTDFFTCERDGESVIVENVKSKRVTLNKNGEEVLSVYFNDFSHLVIWTQFNAPFIAIEAWNGLPDKFESNHLLTEKYSVDKVKSKDSKTFYHSISFLE